MKRVKTEQLSLDADFAAQQQALAMAEGDDGEDSCGEESGSGAVGNETEAVRRRRAHLASEKKRRNNLKDAFEEMKQMIPQCRNFPHSKNSKESVLRKACDYIRYLHIQRAQMAEEIKYLRETIAKHNIEPPAVPVRTDAASLDDDTGAFPAGAKVCAAVALLCAFAFELVVVGGVVWCAFGCYDLRAVPQSFTCSKVQGCLLCFPAATGRHWEHWRARTHVYVHTRKTRALTYPHIHCVTLTIRAHLPIHTYTYDRTHMHRETRPLTTSSSPTPIQMLVLLSLVDALYEEFMAHVSIRSPEEFSLTLLTFFQQQCRPEKLHSMVVGALHSMALNFSPITDGSSCRIRKWLDALNMCNVSGFDEHLSGRVRGILNSVLTHFAL